MNTTGKIARLPRDLRNKINSRLENGDIGTGILDWLNSDKTVRKVLAAEFDSNPITKQNLSAWRNGDGYLDWKNQRDAIEFGKEISSDADETFTAVGNNDEGTPGFADKMALWFNVRYMVMAKNLIASSQKAGIEEQEAAFLRIGRHLNALRRAEHSAGRLRLEHKRLEFQKSEGKDAKEKAFWERARSSEVEKELNKTRKTDDYDEEEAAARMREVSIRLFGSCSAFLTEEERRKMEEYENQENAEDEPETETEPIITPPPVPDPQLETSRPESSPVQPDQSKNKPKKAKKASPAEPKTPKSEPNYNDQSKSPQLGTLNLEPGTIPFVQQAPPPTSGGVLGDRNMTNWIAARDSGSETGRIAQFLR